MCASSSRDFSQWNEYGKNVRAELDRQSPMPLDIYETSLATAQFVDDQIEGPFVDYLRALFPDHQLDLMVAIGGLGKLPPAVSAAALALHIYVVHRPRTAASAACGPHYQ